MKHILHILTLAATLWAANILTSCIEDSASTSPADQPEFSTETIDLGTIFTDQLSATYSFRVYNRHSKVMLIDHIGFQKDSRGYFRVNVDGRSGNEFSGVEIRPGDSIFVFVASNIDPLGSFLPQQIEDQLEFTTNGTTRRVTLRAAAQDVERLHALVIDSDTRWSGDRPRQIFDSLVVAPGVTLTIEAGARLHFHDKASMRVRGSLVTLGTAEQPVVFSGDRQGQVISGVSFDIMSRQWEGLRFYPSSRANSMAFTTVENTTWGCVVDSLGADDAAPSLDMLNCRLRNSHGYGLVSSFSWIRAIGCEIAEAASGAMAVEGGRLDMNHCTLSNYYLFSAIAGPCLQLYHLNDQNSSQTTLPYLQASIANTIIYGSSADLSPTSLDLTDVYLDNCLLKSSGSDDDHFRSILWAVDPLFYTDRQAYIFDYRLRPDSPALGRAVSIYGMELPATDYYGTPRPSPAAIGAYELKY